MKKLSKSRDFKIVCNRCGFIEKTHSLPCGVIDTEDFYGHHNCPDGETGTFFRLKMEKTHSLPLGEFEKLVDRMFKDRFVVDTRLFKWAGKKEFIKYIKSFILQAIVRQDKESRTDEREKVLKELTKP